MSVKTMLPILGVGSAVALLGLAAARRQAKHTRESSLPALEPRMQSGVHPSIALGEGDELEGSPALTSDFWDASPESYSLVDSQGRPPSEVEAYDSLDPEDLSSEWLARATEAPPDTEFGASDLNDPAEIPADSISMISDASRHAAALDLAELDEDSDDEVASRR
jgi:hypothetical protein